MNDRRSKERRRSAGTLSPEARQRIEEIKGELLEDLAQLRQELEPAREALLVKRREVVFAIEQHDAIYRAKRRQLRIECKRKIQAVERAAESGIVVTKEVPR